MELTEQSIFNFNFINKNYKQYLNYSFRKETKNILKNLYKIIQQSYNKYNNIFSNEYLPITQESYSIQNITYPKDFRESDFPLEAITYIKNKITKQKRYSFVIKGRKINVYIGYEIDSNIDFHLTIEKILMWLHILSQYSQHKCSQELSIYLYMTSLKKHLPNKGEIIDWINVNTAFTRTCRPKSEIVIYRKEEWFKVFIHETFHCFGLDFSHMDNTIYKVQNHMQSIFNVNVEILLFESYTEFWAELLNEMFFIYIDNPRVRRNYTQYCIILEQIINYQRLHCVLVMNKILRFNETDYNELISRNINNNYKEKTNVFAYYVIKTILFIHFNEMISFCNINNNNNNNNILQFKHTSENVEAFCVFIKQTYNSKMATQLISNLKEHYKNNMLQMDLIDLKFEI